VGVVFWSLPLDTPVIGRPPIWVGWIFVCVGVLIAFLSSAGRLGLELQSPIRRRTAPPATPTPMRQTFKLPVPSSAPLPPPQPVFTDATPRDLVELAKTKSLTRAQIDKLIAPYKGKWLSIS